MRGLTVLRGLERVVLAEVAEAEVSAAEVLVGLALDDMMEQRSSEEQCAMWMALFALGLRNCNATAMAARATVAAHLASRRRLSSRLLEMMCARQSQTRILTWLQQRP